MKRGWKLTAVAVWGTFVLMVLGLGSSFAASKEPLFLKIGTAGSGGTYYYVGTAVSNIVNKYVPGVKMTPEATAGGLENMRRIYRDELDFGMMAPADFKRIKEDKTSGPDRVSFVSGIHSTVQHMLVRADVAKAKGMKTAGDFVKKGAKMGVGAPGSSVQSSNLVLLKVVGLTLDDIEAHKISQSEASEAFKDGVIHGMFVGGGIPLASIVSATQSVDAVLLPFTEDDIKKFQEVAPYQFGYTIPAKTYRGQDKDVYTVGYSPMLVCRSGLDANLVYNVIKAIHDHWQEIADIHPAGKEWVMGSVYRSADWAQSFGYKFHPGMVKYLKEKKNWNPKYEK
ncbi:MAG: TAXI family TRAP transporter solute-binding subunit [Proteobacteria bacterium]|nr:TAXI family TRAP transporter solute-binding subunit [Pseudomonadota bacterium]MBU2227271.1 TAXI family TRAP transporter solute-binding subunit [Pseudomonadota bacterium]MBU2261377.1 TAXI family TRAP transporter solute-binding subunit [Pseudomonadota bacterium]